MKRVCSTAGAGRAGGAKHGRRMDRIAITGGAPLAGVIPISGAKNSAIKLMVASLLTDEPLRLTNMPRLADTRFLGKLLTPLGVVVEENDGGQAGPQTI